MKLNKIEAYKLSDGRIVESEQEAIKFESDLIAYENLCPIFEKLDEDIYDDSTIRAIVENREEIVKALTPVFESNTSQLTVDLNRLRKDACNMYDALCKKLNYAILKGDGLIKIEGEKIRSEMNHLKRLLGTIASSHFEGNENFNDVFSELYPGPDDGMEDFEN